MEPYYSLPKISSYLPSAKQMDRALIYSALAVVALHFLAFGLSYSTFATPAKKISRQNVVIKTVQLNPKLEPVSTAVIVQVPAIEPPPVLPPPLPAPVQAEPVKPTPPTPPTVVAEPEKAAPPKPTPPPPPQPKKVEAKKPEVKPTPPKPKAEAKPAQPKKPATPAPVKKAEAPPKPKPEVDKKALEAEKAKQQAIAAVEEKSRQNQLQLLSNAKESLAKLGETKDKASLNSTISLSDTSIPQRIQSLQIDALPAMGAISLGSAEIKYQDTLAVQLKQALKLPDYGTVKVKLTLLKNGKVGQIEVTSLSDKNKKYIEKTLPSLSFSPFGSYFSGAEQYTFMLTLHNDE